MDERRGSRLARKCLEEIRKKGRLGKVSMGWEKEKRVFVLSIGEGGLEKIEGERREECFEGSCRKRKDEGELESRNIINSING